jgi:hypothetical protein
MKPRALSGCLHERRRGPIMSWQDHGDHRIVLASASHPTA